MIIPPLCSLQTPRAPAWCRPWVPRDQAQDLSIRLAALVGRNRIEGKVEGLGTGFIIGSVDGYIFILTAAHVIVDFARKITPPRGGQHPPMPGLLDD